jgi:ArsR family transcriptional regulator
MNLDASTMCHASTFVNACGRLGDVAARTALPIRPTGIAACCSPLTGGVLDVAAAEQLAHRFKALGDATRVRLLSLIAAADGGEACICDLTEPVALSQPTVSHHMKVLADAGLVTREQRGKWAYYAVVPNAFTELSQALHLDR